jgi:putative hydrolase of the HAD superfamily
VIPRAVSFDAGQTLIQLDTAMLVRRLAERGVAATEAALAAAQPAAWRRYDEVMRHGGHEAPWQTFMTTLLAGAGVAAAPAAALARWLWDEQPVKNLWRQPVPGMFELARELAGLGVPVAILSNSEGKLAELIAEIGWSAPFTVIVDSGRLGVAKPEAAIFLHTAAALGVAPAEVVHVGDAYNADIVGGRAAGMRTIWFGPDAVAAAASLDDDGIATAADAAGVRAILAQWGLPALSTAAACAEAAPMRMIRR